MFAEKYIKENERKKNPELLVFFYAVSRLFTCLPPLCFFLNFSGFSPRSWIFFFLILQTVFIWRSVTVCSFLRILHFGSFSSERNIDFSSLEAYYYYFFFKLVLSKFMFICNFLSVLIFDFFFLFFPSHVNFTLLNKKIKYTCNSLLCLSAGRWRWCKVIFSWRV